MGETSDTTVTTPLYTVGAVQAHIVTSQSDTTALLAEVFNCPAVRFDDSYTSGTGMSQNFLCDPGV